MSFADAVNICTNSSVLRVIMFLSNLIKMIFILVPIGLILMISVDFAKNVVTNDESSMKKNVSVALKRILMAVVLFFIPTIVGFAINLVNGEEKDVIFEGEEATYLDCIANANSEKIAEYEQMEADLKEEELAQRKEVVIPDLPQTGSYENVTSRGEANVYFLNVGSGDCIILESGGKAGMIDTGYDSSVSGVLKILNELKIKELEFVIITHGHVDHISGYGEISDKIKIKNLYIKEAGIGKHYGYSKVINKAKKAGTKVNNVSPTTNQDFTMGSIQFKFYNKGYNVYSDMSRGDNGNSIATLATINGVRVYFSGDIGNYYGDTTESDTAKEIGKVDVYKVAHHGYVSFNNHEDALQALSPTYAVFTNYRVNATTASSRIKNNSPNFKAEYYTGDGTIIMSISSNGTITFIQD